MGYPEVVGVSHLCCLSTPIIHLPPEPFLLSSQSGKIPSWRYVRPGEGGPRDLEEAVVGAGRQLAGHLDVVVQGPEVLHSRHLGREWVVPIMVEGIQVEE